ATLGRSLAAADEIWLFTPPDLGWDTAPLLAELGARGHSAGSIEALATALAARLRPGDHVVVMSNGAFGGLHGRLREQLRGRAGCAA
ncbi:MAG: UDP-N-acetylmuramate:L-alanyl-gamma-D-glutamyl-meso-diaminopimelate ligase, partial [Gammaproteobacteria bacterium]|nr:UDP-N-acetylmuramate:L-alanyl-gamma-D-glutamyl-meso-diaminopimelate ligase [Gammaproteobacteria bacterium]